MSQTQRQHFFELLTSFKCGMMVTHARNGELHARPMVIARVDDAGDLWLVSDVHSEKVEEIAADARVNLTLQEGQRFLAVSGKAEVVRDAAQVRALWEEPWKTWFPAGPDDPTIVLLRIHTLHGEYWDNSGAKRVSFLFEAAKAYLTGTTPDLDRAHQGKVALTT